VGDTSGRRSPPLKSPDPLSVLSRLGLSSGKAAELCGVTRRQLSYWTTQGAVEPAGERNGSRPRYGWESLARVLMLKQVRDQGRGVRRAKRVLEEFLRRVSRPCEEWSPDERMEFLGRQAQRLEKAAEWLRGLAVAEQRSANGGRANAALQDELARLACWMQRARQSWAGAVSRESGLLADIDACRRVALFADLLEIRIGSAIEAESVPGQEEQACRSQGWH
jgi:DNA-binding transcriptional MerR regulator